MTNADLANLLHRAADNYIAPFGYHTAEEKALRNLANEISAQPDAAPMRLWAMPGTKYVSIPEQQGAHLRFAATRPGPDWHEVALKEEV